MRDTILIVEDDEMICQGIVDALQLRNWKTDVAATCEEAEKKIKEYTYMLYILDMKLPGWQRDFSLPENQNCYGKSGFVPISV